MTERMRERLFSPSLFSVQIFFKKPIITLVKKAIKDESPMLLECKKGAAIKNGRIVQNLKTYSTSPPPVQRYHAPGCLDFKNARTKQNKKTLGDST